MKSDQINQGRPSVAVVTVCRNALDALKLTCESVQKQQYSPLLHIVVDGDSDDGTKEWLKSRRDQFAIALSEPDNGIYDAMNKAVDVCPSVDWLIFLNAGDVFSSDKLLDSIHTILLPKIDFIFGDVEIQNVGGGPPRTFKVRRDAKTEMPGCHQACFVRAELMKALHFDLTYKVAGDFECWLRATHRYGRVSGFFDGTIACIAPEGFSAQHEDLLQSEYVQAIKKYIGSLRAEAWLIKRKLRLFILFLRKLVNGNKKT